MVNIFPLDDDYAQTSDREIPSVLLARWMDPASVPCWKLIDGGLWQ